MNPRILLWPLGLIYGIGQRIDRIRKSVRSYRSRLPVISIGNISVGGSGKTPLTMYLVDLLQREHRVLVLSRGYGREGDAPVIWRAGEPFPDPRIVGDEPALMARIVRHGVIGVATDRAALLRQLEEELHDAVVLLDDGFQHYRLVRDLDIVIVDNRTVRNPRVVPSGDLREPLSALRRAGIIVAASDAAEELARRWMGERAAVVRMSVKGTGVMRWEDKEPYDGSAPLLVTGIAEPERVEQTLRDLGVIPVDRLIFSDHHRYDERDVRRIEESMRRSGARVIITTGKDAVKLARFPTLREHLHVVDISVQIDDLETMMILLNSKL